MSKFSFGENWLDYAKLLTEERIRIATESLQHFTGLPTLDKMTFLDIGCGSGLFSLAAQRLGAIRIVSVDVDPSSVQCTNEVRQQFAPDTAWDVRHGSILDAVTSDVLPPCDIVYAWGSLHHTGSMWTAIGNAARLTTPNGYFYLSLYNNADGRWGSKFWVSMKNFYNKTAEPMKRLIEGAYMAKLIAYYIVNRRNPVRVIREFKRKRGMSWRHDIIDWLGGYPYEFATVEEVFKFMKQEFPDFTLRNIKTTNGLGTNQYLFRRTG